MLAGERSSSAFFSNSTAPVEASIRISVGALPSNPPSPLAPDAAAAGSALPQTTAADTTPMSRPRDSLLQVSTARQNRKIGGTMSDVLAVRFQHWQSTFRQGTKTSGVPDPKLIIRKPY